MLCVTCVVLELIVLGQCSCSLPRSILYLGRKSVAHCRVRLCKTDHPLGAAISAASAQKGPGLVGASTGARPRMTNGPAVRVTSELAISFRLIERRSARRRDAADQGGGNRIVNEGGETPPIGIAFNSLDAVALFDSLPHGQSDCAELDRDPEHRNRRSPTNVTRAGPGFRHSPGLLFHGSNFRPRLPPPCGASFCCIPDELSC
jgi:hypothetical protein